MSILIKQRALSPLARACLRVALGCFVAAPILAGCGKSQPKPVAQATPAKSPPPAWLQQVELNANTLCGVGVAGAGYPNSPYPRELANQRAVRNLAGVLGTRIEEAIIDKATHRGQDVQFVRAVTVDDALIERVQSQSEVEYWVDDGGLGPFAQVGFTYAHACISAAAAATLVRMSPQDLTRRTDRRAVSPSAVPAWIARTGKQAGGRLCAVGFSLPMFHADRTFEAVVEDIRAQLADVLQTFVSSYTEDLVSTRYQLFEAMTVATNQAVSKGVVVTDFWYDLGGIGPYKRQRTTYGWGCVYPMDVLQQCFAAAEKQVDDSDQKNVIARVRERARDAFEALDGEIDKHESTSERANAQGAQAPQADDMPSIETANPADEPPSDTDFATSPEPSTH